MIKNIIILTMSEKYGKKCVSAYDTESEKLIRLVSDAESGDGISGEDLEGINLLDEVTVDIVRECPIEEQTENVLIDLDYGIRSTGITHSVDFLGTIQSHAQKVFCTKYFKLDYIDRLRHSLEIVKITDMKILQRGAGEHHRPKTKMNFTYNNNEYHNFAVTDRRFFWQEMNIASGYAVISIPVSGDFTAENGYYKYIAAIYPDDEYAIA